MARGRGVAVKEAERIKLLVERMLQRPETPTQDDLADAVGVSQQTISNIVSGLVPSYSTARLLADYEGIGVEELLGGKPTNESAREPPWRTLPGWEAGAAEALRRYSKVVTDELLRRIGSTRSAHPPVITAQFILRQAEAWLEAEAAEDTNARAEADAERVRQQEAKRKK